VVNIKQLVEHYITRIRINAGAFDIAPASVQLDRDNSHFDQTNRKITIGMKELLELFETSPEKPSLLIFHHELYHFLSSSVQEKYLHPSDTERLKKVNRSIASFSSSKTQPYIDLFLFANNTIQGILDERLIDRYISSRKREGGRTGLIKSDIDEELNFILKLLPGKMEGRDPVFIEDYKRTIFRICDAISGIGKGMFEKKLIEYTGKVPTSIYSLRLTLLLFLELHKNRSVGELFVDLYKRILTGEVCSNAKRGLRKKIDLIEVINGGTYSCRWVRSSLLPFRWVDASMPDPEKKQNRSCMDDGTMRFSSRGKQFSGRSIIRFKTCRLPLTEEKVAVPRRIPEKETEVKKHLPRHICMIINPANEANSPEDIPLFFSELTKKSAEIIMELKEQELQFQQSVLEIYTLHLGIINEPRFPMDESRTESGLVIIHINQLLGKDDNPELTELIFNEKQTVETYLLAGLEEQFFYSHTNVQGIRVMPKIFTDEKLFSKDAGPAGRIIMLTYHQYNPEGDFRFGEMLFTSEEVKKRIEYFYVVDSKSDIAEFEKMIKRSKE
jgi:hypothetical protein